MELPEWHAANGHDRGSFIALVTDHLPMPNRTNPPAATSAGICWSGCVQRKCSLDAAIDSGPLGPKGTQKHPHNIRKKRSRNQWKA